MGELLSYPKFRAHTSTGIALSGGKLYTYASGTVTPKATYSDQDLTTPNLNPVILDTDGEAVVWLDGEYYLVLHDENDVEVWTMDDVIGSGFINNSITSSVAELNILTGVTVTAAELNNLDGLTATAAELNYNDITTVGESEDYKAVTQGNGTIKIGTTGGDQTINIESHDGVDGGLKLADTLVTASAAELNVLDGITATTDQLNIGASVFVGYTNRSEFRYKNADDIYIGAGSYHHNGTSEQVVYWDTEITFSLGSAGSNVNSINLGADQWHYIYLDDSAIVTQGTALLDADCFLNTTTAPGWSGTKKGWYSGDDRCIFAILTDDSSDILEFFNSGDLFVFADYYESRAETNLSDTWVDVVLDAPAFATKIPLFFYFLYDDEGCRLYWRTKGQIASVGHICGAYRASTRQANSTIVVTDSAQTIEIRHDEPAGNEVQVGTDGYYFPKGM